jgi:hypothetical protein
MVGENMEDNIENWKNEPAEMNKTPSLLDLIGKEFLIIKYENKPGTDYVMSYITTDLGVYRTSSEVLQKQLEKMKPRLDLGKRVKVGLEKVKRYHTFVAPKV